MPAKNAALARTAALDAEIAGSTHDANRRRAIRAYLSANRPAIGRLVRGDFEIRTFAEAEKLSTMLASHCPDPEQAAIGIWELLSNAIEHGNFEIDFATKSALLLAGTYQQELDRRAVDPRYADRLVRIRFRQTSRQVRLSVEDDGPGFDFARVLEAEPPAFAPNGRGIAMARQIAFASLTYKGAGNVVVATMKTARPA